MELELDLSNYATKADLKNATGVNSSKLAKKVDLASLKSDVDKLDIDKFNNLNSTNLNKLKNKGDKLDVDKLVLVPVDLSKLSDVVKHFKKMHIKDIKDKRPDITNLATNTIINAKINVVKNKIANITNLATTTALTAFGNRIPNVSNLVKKTDYDTKISETENKITTDNDCDKYITTQEFYKLTSENFTARLAQAKLETKKCYFK